MAACLEIMNITMDKSTQLSQVVAHLEIINITMDMSTQLSQVVAHLEIINIKMGRSNIYAAGTNFSSLSSVLQRNQRV